VKKTICTLRPLKDHLGVKYPGVYCVPCECGKMYVGQTSRNIGIRCKEHMRHLRVGQPEKSAMAEHMDTGHSMKFNNTCRLAKAKDT
jgi:hypothetical protein